MTENTINKVEKPEVYDDQVKRFLNELRDSGVTNMYGSPSYLEGAFGFTANEARDCFFYWKNNIED
jgi:hypothetical protein